MFKSWVDGGGRGDQIHVLNETLLKQLPHVIRGVDFLHLHFCVNVTMSQEVHVCIFYLEEKTVLKYYIGWDTSIILNNRLQRFDEE